MHIPSGFDLASGFANISVAQLALVAVVGLFASLVGGVAGYGTGALMPLVLVPIVGPGAVVPIVAISAMLNNTSRAIAFREYIMPRHVVIVLLGAVPLCVLSAYGYTLLDSRGAAVVIGLMLMAMVPLRRFLKRRNIRVRERGLALGALGYGAVVGGTVGSGVILLSLLMAAGLGSAAVIATDAAISIVIGLTRLIVFGLAGVVTPQVLAMALLIGCVTVPGAFLAKAFVERMPVHMHAAILDIVVMLGGAMMLYRAVLW